MHQKGLEGLNSLADEITELLRERIINGEYKMGERLIESKLAREMCVSRTPIREALKQLEQEQLVESAAGKGWRAKSFSQKDMADIYEVRKAVERLAIIWAIENANAKELAALKQQLDLMGFYTTQNYYAKLLIANEEFHNMIYRMTGSRFIVQILKSYQDYVHIARMQTLRKEINLPDIYKEHEAIYQAIEERNIAAGINAVDIHLDRSCRRAQERWTE